MKRVERAQTAERNVIPPPPLQTRVPLGQGGGHKRALALGGTSGSAQRLCTECDINLCGVNNCILSCFTALRVASVARNNGPALFRRVHIARCRCPLPHLLPATPPAAPYPTCCSDSSTLEARARAPMAIPFHAVTICIRAQGRVVRMVITRRGGSCTGAGAGGGRHDVHPHAHKKGRTEGARGGLCRLARDVWRAAQSYQAGP